MNVNKIFGKRLRSGYLRKLRHHQEQQHAESASKARGGTSVSTSGRRSHRGASSGKNLEPAAKICILKHQSE